MQKTYNTGQQKPEQYLFTDFWMIDKHFYFLDDSKTTLWHRKPQIKGQKL